MNEMNSNIKSQGNEAAIINVLMYLDIEDVPIKDGRTFQEITEALGTIYDSQTGYNQFKSDHWENGLTEADYSRMYKERQRQYQILVNAATNNPHLASMVIGNQSMKMTPSYEKGGLEACTFTDSNGNVIVAYRGTGSGEWIDNGEGVAGYETDTEQQREAMEYFDRVVRENNYNEDMNIIITGHSKGGNKAQYTTVNSENRDLIDKCFNFDGQGMSPEAIKKFKLSLGEESFNKAINKMYGFYSENDFVHVLGIPLVPNGNRYYFESQLTKGIEDIAKNHYFDDYLNEDGSFSRQTNKGSLAKLVENFALEMVALAPEDRSKVANIIMSLMQGKNETVNGDNISEIDKIPGGFLAIYKLIPELLGTPDGLKALAGIIGEGFESVEERYGVGWKWAAAVALGVIVVVNLSFILKVIGVASLINVCDFIAGKIIEFGKMAFNLACKIGDALLDLANGLKSWVMIKLNSGYIYVSSNPHIKVNTDRLRAYAYRLSLVNKRLMRIDDRLQSLYFSVGLDDLGSLIRADMLMGYSLKLKRCINYLEDAAEEFEDAEGKILRKLSRA